MANKNHMCIEAFAEEGIWILHQILPEDREAVLSILIAYRDRASKAADERASAAALVATCGGRG